MVTHHVSRRRACPAPVGQLTPSRRGVVSSITAAQAERTSSKGRYCFYPWERFTAEPPNTIGLARCKCPTPSFLHSGERMAIEQNQNRTGAIPMLKGRGLRAEGKSHNAS